MRRVSTVFLLFIMSFYVLGIFPFYLAMDYTLKKSFLSKTENESVKFTQLKFSHAEFSKIDWDEENEFTYHNQKFDVFKIENYENKIIVHGVFDKEEDALMSALDALGDFSKEKSKRTVSLFKLLTAEYVSFTANNFFIIYEKYFAYSFFSDNYNFSFARSLIKPPIRFLNIIS